MLIKGTGKSMSIICGMVTWLRDNDVRIKEHLEKVLKTSQNVSYFIAKVI